MPDKWLQGILGKIGKREKVTGLTVLLVGLATHFCMFSNKLFNYNELSLLLMNKLELIKITTIEGRWFVGLAGQLIGENYSLSPVVGILGILCIAVSAILVVSLLDIKSRLSCILVGCIMITFPSLVSFFTFTILGDAWFFSVLLGVLAVFLASRYRYGFLPGAVAVGCSLGIHQAYVSVTIALMFTILFFEIFQKENGIPQLWKKAVAYAGTLILGFGFYFTIMKISLSLVGGGLTGYHGINEMTSFSIRGIAKGIVYSYLYFLRYFFSGEYSYSVVLIIGNVILAVMFILVLFLSVRKSMVEKRFGQMGLKALFIVLIPIGCNGLPVLLADRVGAGVDRYMMYSLIFFFVLMIKVIDLLEEGSLSWGVPAKKFFSYTVVLILLWNAGHNYVLDNQAYNRLDAVTTSTNMFMNRLVSRMEATDGWDKEMPVFFATDGQMFNDNYDVTVEAFDNLTELRGTAYEDSYNENAIANFMKVYLHVPVTLIDESEKEAILNTNEYKEMSIYPDSTSIKIINNVMVIKLND